MENVTIAGVWMGIIYGKKLCGEMVYLGTQILSRYQIESNKTVYILRTSLQLGPWFFIASTLVCIIGKQCGSLDNCGNQLTGR